MAYSKGKHSAKSKTRNKNTVKYIVIPIVAIGLFIGYKELSSAVTSSDGEISQNLASLPQDIINTDNPAIAKLVKMAPMYPRIYNILNNVDDYPQELLVMASKKPETINFVADYPEHKGDHSTSENITVEGEYTKGKIPLFMQWDERWGYDKYGPDFFAINGCGPTALSMVTVGLTGNTNISPRYVENFSKQNGYLVPGVGTAWSLMTDGAKKLGLKSKVIPLSSESIINTLEKGHPIIATMGPGHFTTEGHYIVLTGVDSDGKIIVNDSDSKQRTSETWDVDVFLKEAKNLWAFSL